MRKLILTIAAAAALLAPGSLMNRADAMTIGTPAGLRAAIDGVALTDRVHCVPGWRHHHWRWGRPTWDGCYYGTWWREHRFHRFHRFVGVHRVHRFVGVHRVHRVVGVHRVHRVVGVHRVAGLHHVGGRHGRH